MLSHNVGARGLLGDGGRRSSQDRGTVSVTSYIYIYIYMHMYSLSDFLYFFIHIFIQ